MINNQPMRNHVSSAVTPIIVVIIVLLFAMINMRNIYAFIGIIVLAALMTALSFIYWYKTIITFTDDGVYVERNTIFKKKKTIPYAKIASLNADRTIFDRIFGTVSLKVNINSSRNASVPDATFIFKKDLADSVYAEISQLIHGAVPEVEEGAEEIPAVTFRDTDLVLHGMIGTSSLQVVMLVFVTAMGVVSAFFMDNAVRSMGALIASMILLIIFTIIPILMILIKYYDFKLTRVGDTIKIQNGAIQNYKTSFEISRINVVRIKRTFFARLFGRACIEVEVVGLGGEKESPTIALLSKEDKIKNIMETILPEFIYDAKPEKQAKGAAAPMAVNAVIGVAVTFLLSWFIIDITRQIVYPEYPFEWVDQLLTTMTYLMLALPILFAVWGMFLSLKYRALDRGEDFFTVVTGLVDRSTNTINYDKVQIVSIRSGLIAKRLGLAKCSVKMLSSLGSKKVVTGYFRQEELAAIAERMIEKVNERLPAKTVQNDTATQTVV